jgi:hypothetical protein
VNRFIANFIVAAICLLGFRAAHAQNDEEEQGKKIAEEAVKIGAVDYLTDREFKLDGPQLVATARAIDPKEHVKIELREFNLLPGRVDLKVKINAPFRFEGRITIDDAVVQNSMWEGSPTPMGRRDSIRVELQSEIGVGDASHSSLLTAKPVDDKTSDVRGEANIGQIVTIEAKYWVDDRGLHIDARATELKFSVAVRELAPEDAAGGKRAVAKMTLAQLARQREELLRDFNDWQAAYQRKLP